MTAALQGETIELAPGGGGKDPDDDLGLSTQARTRVEIETCVCGGGSVKIFSNIQSPPDHPAAPIETLPVQALSGIGA